MNSISLPQSISRACLQNNCLDLQANLDESLGNNFEEISITSSKFCDRERLKESQSEANSQAANLSLKTGSTQQLISSGHKKFNFIVYGLGISGISTAKKLFEAGLDLIACDDNYESLKNFSKKFPQISVVEPSKIQLNENSIVVFAPGIPLYFPKRHAILEKIFATKAQLICDIELFFRFNNFGNNGFVAITGTNGKSTTTALSGFVLKELGVKSEFGGNIGVPAFDLPQEQQNFDYIFETSSFQLDLINTCRFNVAALLNITKDHIDRHGNMQNYIAAKKRIFANQQAGDFAIIDFDCPNSRQVFEELKNDPKFLSELIPVSNKQIIDSGISLIGSELSLNIWGKRLKFDLKSEFLLGSHNWQNMAFAFAIAICRLKQSSGNAEFALQKSEEIIAAIKKFKGLPHRMQIIGEIAKIRFINDSKATNAESSANALAAFDNIFWILGGRPKEGGIESLTQLFGKVKKAYLIGEASAEFAEILAKNSVKFELCGDLKNAFEVAFADAKSELNSVLGLANSLKPNILLSPACASFDQWKNFEERGRAFCEYFSQLKNDIS